MVVRVSHNGDVLATDVDVADSTLSRARGLMFRRSIPEDYALVFAFDDVSRRDVHMLFVPFPIDALWLVEDEVRQTKRLRPWIGFGSADADTLIELPAGATAAIDVGDTVSVDR